MNRLCILLLSLLALVGCGGDDDGRRLGDLIVGTWQRGWEEGDVMIEGDTAFEPEDFSYDLFIFRPDGSYNGMVRSGTFSSIDVYGDIIYEGDYRCDNQNLKLEFTNEEGRRQTILAQVLMFSEQELQIRYENEEYNITVSLRLRKVEGDE